MPTDSIVLADDLENASKKGLIRSHLLRNFAEEMGRRLQTSLRIIYVSNIPQHFFSKKQLGQIRIEQEKMTKALQKEMSDCSVDFKAVVKEGPPVETILDYLKEASPEMIVIGSRGHRGVKKALIGSVSEEILRHASVPVLVFGPEVQKSGFALSFKKQIRILILTDLSSASAPAEKYGLSLAKRLGASATLCYSVGQKIRDMKDMLYTRRVVSAAVDQMFEDERTDGEKRLAQRVKTLKTGRHDIEGLLLKQENDIGKIIPSKLGDKFDLIVMGTHSRNKFLTAFIGSSARSMILKSVVPVMIVRSPKK